MKAFYLLFLLALPLRAANDLATASTAQVLYWAGFYDAQAEGTVLTIQVATGIPADHVAFRQMAGVNTVIADLARMYGCPSETVAYFTGRAAAFNQLADLAGEP